MTKLHKILFLLWKFKMFVLGYRKGVLVKIYSSEKGKWIKGVITSLTGVSVTQKKFGFDLQVQFFEPSQGNDARFFSRSSFDEKTTKTLIRFT